MNTVAAEDENYIILRENRLFRTMSEEQLATIVQLVGDPINFKAGEYLFREDDEPDHIFLIKSGQVEVLKNEADSELSHSLAVLKAGNTIGELSLLDSGRRSASVRAVDDCEVLAIPIRDIENLARQEESISTKLKISLAYELGKRLRDTNEITVTVLNERLEEAEKRVEMGKFISRVLIGICLYMFTLSITRALADMVDSTELISIPILLAFAFGLYRTVKTSPYPASAYGFTLKNWKQNILEAVLFSIPVLIIIVLVKWLCIEFVAAFSDMQLFDLSASTGLDLSSVLMFSLAYALFTPVQEMIARSGMQCSLQMFLAGKYRIPEAILLSNLMFSATHLHVSVVMAVVVLPVGFFWGWLFYRQGSLVGTSVSHAIIGISSFFVIGMPDFMF